MKEKIKKVVTAMSTTLNPEQLARLENVLYREFQDEKQALAFPLENWQRLIEDYEICLTVEGRAESTIKAYRPILIKFFLYVGKPLKSITAGDIRLYLYSYDNKGLSKSYIDNVRRVISAFFTWAHNEGYIIENPCARVKKIKAPDIIRDPLTGAEREALNDVCTNTRDRALLSVLYSTACRVGEVIALDRSDVDLNARTIRVYGSKGKAERMVCINDTAFYYLSKYLAERDDDNPALFVTLKNPHRRISKECVQTTLKKLGKAAGVENVHPHRSRRTMLTDMSTASIPVQNISRYAGHKDVNTTMLYIAKSDSAISSDFSRFMKNS